MKKSFIFILLILSLSCSASAGPLDWAKHHKRFLLMESAAITGASLHARGLHHCRRVNGVEPCDGHYGESWALFGVAAGMSTVVLPSLAEICWRGGDNKPCYAIGYAGSSYQAIHGIQQWGIYKPDKEKTNFMTFKLETKLK